jgi:hypothetical protein
VNTNKSVATFFLQNIDTQTNCPSEEVGIAPIDNSELANALGIADVEVDINFPAELSSPQVLGIIRKYDLNFPQDAERVRIRRRFAHDDLPYKIHTTRELLMMIKGKKPLAVFSIQVDNGRLAEEDYFEAYVSKGTFIKREYCEILTIRPGKDLHQRHVLFARPSQEWRIDAYILLMQTASLQGWNLALERMQGSLLGYTDRENDSFIDYRMQQIERFKTRKSQS